MRSIPLRRWREPPLGPAAAEDSAKCCGAAVAKRDEQPVELAAAQLALAFAGKLADRARHDAAEDLVRLTAGAQRDGALFRADGSVPFGARCPVERAFGVGEMCR